MRLWPALDILPQGPSTDVEVEETQGLVLAALDGSGISAVQEREGGWRVFFPTSGARDAAAASLLASTLPVHVSALDVQDDDWARRSQENISPVLVGRVRISPPWSPRESGPIDVVIQPSMGFGTGHHATTRLCVALLQQIDLRGRRVLDAGTGSGVLAIVASRLGAETVLGVDDDGDALESARENLELNGLAEASRPGAVALEQGDFRGLADRTFDVVVANLTGALLVRGADALLAAVAPGGRLILSGITLEEDAGVRARFGAKLPLRARLEEDGWTGLLYGG